MATSPYSEVTINLGIRVLEALCQELGSKEIYLRFLYGLFLSISRIVYIVQKKKEEEKAVENRR